MSRIGLKPIPLPDGVSIRQEDDTLHISGPKGELSSPVPPGVSLVQEDGVVRFERANDQKQTRAYHGLARALAANAVAGVCEGFQRNLLIEGIGYRAKMEGSSLVLQLGFSHPVEYHLPDGVEAATPSQTEIVISGVDNQLVGQVSAEIRSFRPPEPYKGKGVRYADEHVRRKEAKKK